ncbi:hypothetical protein [Caminibacter pacificus]
MIYKLMKFLLKLPLLFLLASNLNAFFIGVGGFDVCIGKNGSEFHKNCPYSKRTPITTALKEEIKNVNAVSVWIIRNWQENWYPVDTINEDFIKKGYTPIFIFYWFADDISPEFVQKNKTKYFNTLKKFAKYLQKIKGKKIVILNPEYNENGMNDSKDFDILQAQSILLIKKYDKNAIVGVCLGDFGDYNKIWDEYNWNLNSKSLTFSAKLSDFIAFQEMRAVTRNTKKQILNTPYRALAFAEYLHQKYNKPTFLAYIAISSYKAQNLQKEVFATFQKVLPIMKNSANLLGINLFNYIDVPNHKGYFKTAEKYFGIKEANGKKKPSFNEFLKLK